MTPPFAGVPGQTASFQWTVLNQGVNTVSGSWVDSVYLSSDQTWDIGDQLVGRATHNGTLNPVGSYSGLLTAQVPPVVPGSYYVIVRADIQNNIRETDENNNLGYSTQTVPVDVVELTLGQPYQDQLNNGTEHYYKVNVPGHETMSVTLDATQTNGFDELFTRFGAMPDRGRYDFLYSLPFEPDQNIVVPETQAGYYYHLASGEDVPNPPTPYSIKAEIIPFGITSVSPAHIGDNGQVTITIRGARFESGAVVSLVDASHTLAASKVTVIDSATAKARFYFTNAPHGVFDVQLRNPLGGAVAKPAAIELASATRLSANAGIAGNFRPRAGASTQFDCGVANLGNTDVPYAVVRVGIDGGSRWSLRRPTSAFPRLANSSGDTTYAIFPQNSSSATFVVRDLEPGQQVPFTILVANASTRSLVSCGAAALTSVELVNSFQETSEAIRQTILSQPAVNMSPRLLELAGDPVQWQLSISSALVASGLLDSSDMNALAAFQKRNLAKFSPAGGQSSCVEHCQEAAETFCRFVTVTEIFESEECIVGCAPLLIDPPAYAACVGGCFIVIMIKHLVCDTVTTVLCHFFCDPPDCGTIASALGVSGSFLCPVFPRDPNEMSGPSGFGPKQFVTKNSPLEYTAYFENVPNASATARSIRIVDQLDSGLDPRSVRLKTISFGGYDVAVPENRSFYQARVQLGPNFNNLWADIAAGVDIQNNQVRWTITAVDPTTGEQPENALLGLLPPNNTNHIGEGHVTYTVRPRAGTSTGTVITNKASIIFDTNEPIETNPWWNTIDSGAPTSSVAALPAISSTNRFMVSWSGADDLGGAGLQDFDIYVSDNGTNYQPWLLKTTNTSELFDGLRGHTYSFYSIARDNTDNLEQAPTTPDATTLVTGNSPPIVAPIPPQTVDEGTQLTVAIIATDNDVPTNHLTFTLVLGAPTDAVINATKGVFTWTPTEEQGPSTNFIDIVVTDDGTPSMSTSQTMMVVVNEVNIAPTLLPVPNKTAYVLTPLRLTNVVSDPDIPANKMAFRLVSGAPLGARINPTNGVFSWTPARTQAPSSNFITVVVTDNGVPPLSATNSFSVVVGDFAELSLGFTVVRAGQPGSVPITMNSSAGITNLNFILEAPEDRLTNFALPLFLPDVAGSIQPTGPNRSLITLRAAGATPLMGNRELSTLAFSATTNDPSGFIPLSVLNLTAMQGNGVPVPRTIANNGRVVIVGSAPLLEPLIQTNGQRTLLLYGIPQTAYTIEYNTNMLDAASWKIEWQGTLTNLFQTFESLSVTNQTIFYRARQ